MDNQQTLTNNKQKKEDNLYLRMMTLYSSITNLKIDEPSTIYMNGRKYKVVRVR